VVDRDRNTISLISSLFEGFGSGLYEPETGVVFHNRGSGFCGEADHPNALEPAKRPLHTILPGMVSRAGRPVMSFGVTGGPYQPTGHIQLVTGMVDHGLDIQDTIDRPRSFLRDGKLQLEPRLAGIGATLAAHGHDVVDAPSPVGGAHGITIDWEVGVLTGGSDSRKDGCALAL
jgi:gamma-glutamyltranspeptidase/glutathione hydrolase